MAQRIRHKRGNGAGSCYQQKDGRWVASVVLASEKDPETGKWRQQRRRAYGKSQAEAQAALIRLQGSHAAGALPKAGGKAPTVGVFAQEWLGRARGPKGPWTERTLVRNRQHIGHLSAIARVPLPKLDADMISDLLQAKCRAGMSPVTAESLRSCIRQMLADAIRLKLITVNPASTARGCKVEKREMRTLSRAEVRTMIEAANRSRDYLYPLAVSTGLRHGELLGLTWDDYDPKAGVLHVRKQLVRRLVKGGGFAREAPKSKASRRTVQLSRTAIAALEGQRSKQAVEREQAGDGWYEMPDCGAGLIFTRADGQPMDAVSHSKGFHVFLSGAGLPVVRLHDLRHTFATESLRAGQPVAEVARMLGHSNPSITYKLYAQSTNEGQATLAAAVDGWITG